MGLDFSHGGAHWSYRGFNSFRRRLAQEEGFNLNEMEGFEPLWEIDVPKGRPWSEVNTQLVALLNHSDCDGELSPLECAEVAARLEEILDKWRDQDNADDNGDFSLAYDYQMGRKLLAGMQECVRLTVPLEFR